MKEDKQLSREGIEEDKTKRDSEIEGRTRGSQQDLLLTDPMGIWVKWHDSKEYPVNEMTDFEK